MENTREMNWRKSTYSSNGGGECVETGSNGAHVLVRDTKDNGTGPALAFTPAAWHAFTQALKTR